MKRFVKYTAIALALGAALPLTIAAAQADDDNNSIEIDASGNVIVTSDQETTSKVTALQLSLKVEADPDTEISFDFNPENSMKISEYRYHEDTKRLNIYMADANSVFDSLDSLNIGTVSAKDAEGNAVDVKVNVVKNSLKYVHGDVLVESEEETEEVTEPETTEEAIATTTEPETTEEAIATTAEPETTEEIATTATNPAHIASDEDFCEWAIFDYEDKTGVIADKAEITTELNEESKEMYNITLLDESGNVLDVYVIDPDTGVGVNSANEEVNLPQTGNNSMMNVLVAIGAFLLAGLGFCAVKISGLMKRKENGK
ncbi:MAG: LPXTG cell wall anchor domain-containing protein [Oscillospiraceae bacterium]|nr:LPXTG cell wall anchor domain-containing protein [Oscillospiraceae bacterium]